MTFLDRYILRQFLLNFVLLFVLLFAFICIIDLFLNLDRFVEAAERLVAGRAPAPLARLGTTVVLIADFYGPRVFQFYSFLLGIVTIGAVGFTLVQFHRHRELTAFLAAGVSLHRVVMPIIVAAVVLNLFQIANREIFLPRYAPQLLRGHGEIGRAGVESFRVAMVPDGHGRVVYARTFDTHSERMEQVVAWEYDPSGLSRIIRAEAARWAGNGWALEEGRATSVGRLDQPTAPPPEPIDFLVSDLNPHALLLRRHLEFRQMLSLGQINELVRQAATPNAEELMRIRYGRFSQVLINLLALMITLPFFMIREPRNLWVATGNCAAVGLAAQIGGAVGVAVGLPLVPAAASVFAVPLMILLPLAVWRMARVET